MTTYNILNYRNYITNLDYNKNIKFDYILINNTLYNKHEEQIILTSYIKLKDKIKIIDNNLIINNKYIDNLHLEYKQYNIIFINEYVDIKELTEFLNYQLILTYYINQNHKKKLLELFQQLISALDIINIPWWIENGTLLGAIRHNHMINWDNDIDIGILYSDQNKILQNKNIFEKFNIRLLKNKTTGLYWQVDSKINSLDNLDPEIHIDIFMYENNNNILYNTDNRFKYPDLKSGHCNTSYNLINLELFPLKKKIFEGLLINIPNKSHNILSNALGNDYLKNAIIKYNNEYITKINLDSKFGKLLK